MNKVFDERLIRVGEVVTDTVRYSRGDISAFARMSFDANPLHVDPAAAKKARFGEIIASGQQTAAVLMGLLATYFSRRDDGVPREMLCLNMNFSFKHPVFAEQSLKLRWTVSSVEPKAKLNGLLAHLDGQAWVGDDKPAVVARGTILVTTPAA